MVEPRWDTRDPGDVLIETAKALGGKAAEALPFENMAAAVKESFRSAHAHGGNSGRRRLRGVLQEGSRRWRVVAGRRQRPCQSPEPKSPEPMRRVNFVMPSQPVAARAFAGDAAQMPFMLHVYPSAAFADGRAAHLPWLQEMPDPMTTVMWGSWVEINPETAHKLDIHEGDVLAITSPQGTIELPAFVYPGLRPDVIAIPVGQGHTQFGRYAQNRGANPLRISASALDQASGAVVQTGVRVSAAKTGRFEPLIRFGASDAREHHELPLHQIALADCRLADSDCRFQSANLESAMVRRHQCLSGE